jgi:threonine/homoserine/homoserine lactone efflux protein
LILSLLAGLVTGFIISVPPLGPTYFAILARGLKKDVRGAVAIGAGAGFMDMFYILIAYGGVTILTNFLPAFVDKFFIDNQKIFSVALTLLGCAVVIIYGIKIMKTKSVDIAGAMEGGSSEEIEERRKRAEERMHKTEHGLNKILHSKKLEEERTGPVADFFAGVLLCLSSVTLPASWFAIVGYLKGYGVINDSFISGFLLAIGVLAGTTLWFYLLGRFVSTNSHKIKPSTLNKLNLFTGIFLIFLGVLLLYKAVDFMFFHKINI